MLGAPLGAGTAHVVLLGAVGIDQRPERAEEFREIAGEAGCFAGLTGHDTLLRPLSAVGAGSTGLLFRRRRTRLGSVHNRSEFIKNWYESVRPWLLLRSSLLGSYGDARYLDVTRVTYCRFYSHDPGSAVPCPRGCAPLHQRQLPQTRRRRRSSKRGLGVWPDSSSI